MSKFYERYITLYEKPENIHFPSYCLNFLSFFRLPKLQNIHKVKVFQTDTMLRITMKIWEKDRIELGVAYTFLTTVFTVLLRRFSVGTSVILLFCTIFLLHQFYWRRRKLPPGPTPLPLLGNTLSIDLRHPARTFASWHAIYGPVFTVWMPHPMIVLASHEVLKEALVKQGPSFAGRPMGYIWSLFTHNPEHGDGIILCEGERWEEVREFAHKIFRNFGLGRTLMEEKIVNHIRYMVNQIDAQIGDYTELTLDLEEPVSLCVANIIQDFVLGKSYAFGDKQFKKFKNLIDAVLADVASKTVQMVNAYPVMRFLPIPALKRYKENGFALQRYFLHAIHEHVAQLSHDGEPRDFMEAYLREMVTNQKGNPHYNHMTLALASGDLWTGGMETTVTTLRWALIYMLYHPTVQNKCRKEIEKIFGTEQPSYANRKELPYVEATLAEVQRIVNVLPWAIPHRTLNDVSVNGFDLPKGTVVLPQYGTVQFDPHYYPEAEKFQPERFLTEEGYFKKRPEMNPFGMGKRSCLGENLARYELFLLFSTLLQKYEFIPVEGEQLPSLDRSEGMTNVPQAFVCLVRKTRTDNNNNNNNLKREKL